MKTTKKITDVNYNILPIPTISECTYTGYSAPPFLNINCPILFTQRCQIQHYMRQIFSNLLWCDLFLVYNAQIVHMVRMVCVQCLKLSKILKHVFPSESANGAYRLYDVGKNRLEMLILFDAKKVTVKCLHLKWLEPSKMLHKIPNVHMLLILPFYM